METSTPHPPELMPGPTPSPTTGQILLAAVSTLLIMVVGGGLDQEGRAFSLSFPFLVVGVAALMRSTDNPVARHGLALLLLAPAASLGAWGVGTAELHLAHTADAFRQVATLRLAANALHGVPPLLAAAGLTLIILRGWRMAPVAGAMLGGAAASAAAVGLLDKAHAAILVSQSGSAALLSTWAMLASPLSLLGMALGMAGQVSQAPVHHPQLRAVRVLRIASLGLVMWVATPSIPRLLGQIPPPVSPHVVTELPSGLGASGPVAVPQTMVDLLDAQGMPHDMDPWECNPRTAEQFLSFPRPSLALALPPETPLGTLDVLTEVLLPRGLTRLALVGQAPEMPGPIGARMAWPTVDIILSHPPREVAWASLDAQGWTWLDGPPDAPRICGLLPDTSLNVATLMHAVLAHLQPAHTAPCAAIVYVPPSQRGPTLASPPAHPCPPR